MQQSKTDVTRKNKTKTPPSAPQTPRIQANHDEANLITFSPVVEQQVPAVQGATEFKNNRTTEKSTKEEGFRMDTQSKTIRPQ